MKKRKLISALTSLFILLCVIAPAAHAEERGVSVFISGRRLVSDVSPVLYKDTTLVPIRAFSDALGASRVTWNDSDSTASVSYKGITVTAGAGRNYIEANGRCLYSQAENRLINDRLFVPVRSIAKALGASVEWNENVFGAYIVPTGSPIESADEYYNEDDLYWLSRIIYAESNLEPFEGKIGVGCVIMNRVASSEFPDSVYGVVFDRNYGVQFTPVSNNMIYNDSSPDCVRAAKICLEGYSMDDDILYFMNVDMATNMWIRNNRPFAFRIGTHSFYY